MYKFKVHSSALIDKDAIIIDDNYIQYFYHTINCSIPLKDNVFSDPSVFTKVMGSRSFIERKNEFKPAIAKGATVFCGIKIGKVDQNLNRIKI